MYMLGKGHVSCILWTIIGCAYNGQGWHFRKKTKWKTKKETKKQNHKTESLNSEWRDYSVKTTNCHLSQQNNLQFICCYIQNLIFPNVFSPFTIRHTILRFRLIAFKRNGLFSFFLFLFFALVECETSA